MSPRGTEIRSTPISLRKEVRAIGKNQWVSPRKDGWAVHGEGSSRDTKVYPTQEEAWNRAVEIAKNQRSEVIVQGRDGRIKSKDSYGNDPCSPKDKEH